MKSDSVILVFTNINVTIVFIQNSFFFQINVSGYLKYIPKIRPNLSEINTNYGSCYLLNTSILYYLQS